MERQSITVDIVPTGLYTRVLYASQNDFGRPMGVMILSNNIPMTLTGYTADIVVQRPDGEVVTVQGTISGSEVRFDLTAEMTAVIGLCNGEARIKKSGENIGASNFILSVE